MKAFDAIRALVLPLDRANVDTDVIIPKQYLKSVERTGFGVNLFDDWRYLDPGKLGQDHSQRRINPDFVLNQRRYKGAQILLTRDNFACGSSREHAVWALMDYGFRVVIAPSFADIFYSNAGKNGLLAIRLDAALVDELFARTLQTPSYHLTVNLAEQLIRDERDHWPFKLDPFLKRCLLSGLDEIGMILEHAEEIRAYEARRARQAPWLFAPTRDHA